MLTHLSRKPLGSENLTVNGASFVAHAGALYLLLSGGSSSVSSRGFQGISHKASQHHGKTLSRSHCGSHLLRGRVSLWDPEDRGDWSESDEECKT